MGLSNNPEGRERCCLVQPFLRVWPPEDRNFPHNMYTVVILLERLLSLLFLDVFCIQFVLTICGASVPLQIPNSADAQAPFIKCHSIFREALHILP
jgi:hypothetical protein